jgi:2-keto-4-pentenoate hydratase
MDDHEVIEAICESHRQGVYNPSALRGRLTMDDGYRILLGLLERWRQAGERQAGWKVGLTAASIRQQVGYHEPIFAVLLASGQRASGCTVGLTGLRPLSFETELCLTVGETLAGPGVTVERARQAIAAVAPAFELVERRAVFAEDPPLAIADNAQQRYFVTGEALRPLPAALSLREVQVQVAINGVPAASASGEAVLGDPAASLAWLANALSRFGRRLDAGLQVMSGSFVPMFPITAGDRIEARFEPIGTVSARFEA